MRSLTNSRLKAALARTRERRPDLLERVTLTDEERTLLNEIKKETES